MCKAPAFVYPSRLTVTRSRVGCTRMYASNPTLSTASRTLLARVSKSGVALDIIEHAYPSSLEAFFQSRFVFPSSGRLEIFLERPLEAEAAGYPRLA